MTVILGWGDQKGPRTAVKHDTKMTPMGRISLGLGTHGQVRIVRRGAGWQADTMLRDWDGVVRRVRSSGPTKSAADQSIQLVLRDRRYAGRDVITRETKFPDVANKWFAELNDLSPSTRQRYRERLDRFIIPAFKEVRMREITVGLIDRHLNAVKQTHGAASAKVTKTILSGVFGLATRHDALPSNPCRDVARISVKPKRVARPISAEDFRALREWFATDVQAQVRDLPDLVAFLAATGFRIGEACALRWEDVDLINCTASVRGTVLRVVGEGLRLSEPKSRAGRRTVELPSWCVAILMVRALEGTELVFPAARRRDQLRDPSNTAHHIKQAFVSMGLEDVTSHAFRRMVATMMDDAGLSPRNAADQLGHAKPSLTMDVYMTRRNQPTGAAAVLERLG
jgi:integrase